MLPTTFGVLTFLLFLLLAVQVLYNLYATSAVTAAAYDGARLAAGFEAVGDPQAKLAAEVHIRSILGRYGRDRVALAWPDDPTGRDVVLTISAENPSFLPKTLQAPLGFDTIRRTVRVRVERPR